MNKRPPSDIVLEYWEKRGGKPPPRPRHPLTPDEEHAYLVKGSELCNQHNFYDGHDEWEEVWRRASGSRRRLLHGIIQVAVGYEHLKRGNLRGMRSLLRQGADKLSEFAGQPNVELLIERARADADRAANETDLNLESCNPPKVMLVLEGRDAGTPDEAFVIEVPLA